MSVDSVLLPDWTTKDGGTVSTSKVCFRYRSPAGQYFNNLAAVQKFLAYSGTMAGDTDAESGSLMDESGSDYIPTPRKGRQLKAILKESITSIGRQEQPENYLFFKS